MASRLHSALSKAEGESSALCSGSRSRRGSLMSAHVKKPRRSAKLVHLAKDPTILHSLPPLWRPKRDDQVDPRVLARRRRAHAAEDRRVPMPILSRKERRNARPKAVRHNVQPRYHEWTHAKSAKCVREPFAPDVGEGSSRDKRVRVSRRRLTPAEARAAEAADAAVRASERALLAAKLREISSSAPRADRHVMGANLEEGTADTCARASRRRMRLRRRALPGATPAVTAIPAAATTADAVMDGRVRRQMWTDV
eukprot:TRINITY_DN37644_c0_g1_i1.p1 TRINITY_DN37644_c0_g1~~TRINITY_DN37644_c0_g1_i1.p1  ORF type:complete len:254 (+),score=34.54 TRINITY_DN37644_c0_g1_i1:119-880(+)